MAHGHVVHLLFIYLCIALHLAVYNDAGSSVEFVTDDVTDRPQTFEIKTEDITEHDDMPRPYLCTVCDKRFVTKGHLYKHKQIHDTGTVSYTHLTLPTKRIV